MTRIDYNDLPECPNTYKPIVPLGEDLSFDSIELSDVDISWLKIM